MLCDLDTAEVSEPSEALATDWRGINFLLEQLSPGKEISWPDYQALIADPTSHMVFLSDYVGDVKRRIGMATLCITQSPTGKKAWIEDVVIDKPFRGRGLSHRLIACMKVKAVELGVKKIMLTSRPKRVAANRLYQHEGFTQKETNVYTFDVNPEDLKDYRRDVEEQHLKKVE
ncbi:MAG: GNAT family N-acetyltransferase [Bacteroidales bacterium]|nr:GNAT family N-acetyltransferase [Bacteroidales bacterium]